MAPVTSLTYTLRGYKIVTESQQDAKLLQIARGVWENKGEGVEGIGEVSNYCIIGHKISSTGYMNNI